MIPQAVRAATGQDLIAELVARTAGRRPVGAPVRDREAPACAGIRFLVPDTDGEVAAVSGVADASRLPGVVEAAVTVRPGQRVVRQGCFLDRVGYVLATGDSQAQAGARADRALAALTVEMVPTNGKVRR
jgi:biotin carboxylase